MKARKCNLIKSDRLTNQITILVSVGCHSTLCLLNLGSNFMNKTNSKAYHDHYHVKPTDPFAVYKLNKQLTHVHL